MLSMTSCRQDVAVDSRDRAHEFLIGLPQNEEGAERAIAFRALFADATESEDALRLLCAVYELVAESDILSHSLHDAHMVVSSVTERLELLPALETYVERFLSRSMCDESRLRGLWRYVQELYRLRYSRESASPASVSDHTH